jgi:hypothetical protein
MSLAKPSRDSQLSFGAVRNEKQRVAAYHDETGGKKGLGGLGLPRGRGTQIAHSWLWGWGGDRFRRALAVRSGLPVPTEPVTSSPTHSLFWPACAAGMMWKAGFEMSLIWSG